MSTPATCSNGITCTEHPRPRDTFLQSAEERAWLAAHVVTDTSPRNPLTGKAIA